MNYPLRIRPTDLKDNISWIPIIFNNSHTDTNNELPLLTGNDRQSETCISLFICAVNLHCSEHLG